VAYYHSPGVAVAAAVMKYVAFTLLALVSLGAAAPRGDDAETSPVTKVVNLLADLKAKIVADGKSESNTYSKFACWCEKTTKRKASDITTAEDDLRSLGQQILKLKGKVATLSAEIKELGEKIEDNQDEQESATSLRSKRNGKFMARQEETKQALAALEKAVGALVTGTKLLQTDATMQTMSAVQTVLNTIPSDAPLNNDHMSFLSEFVKNGADGTYAPQSATIQGILTDMYDTFASDLEGATMSEATQNKNYEKLTATLQTEANEMKEIKSRKEEQRSDAESDLADTTATYDDTTDQMKADIAFFDQTKTSCDTKHQEWSLREKLRDEELEGVEKALALLSSDDARDLFASAIKPGVEAASFLQLDTDNVLDVQAVATKAYGLLKAQATRASSFRLATLAVQVRTAKVGHFDKVIKAIDDMVGTLNDEGEADRAKKTQCNDEYQKIARTVSDLDWNIKNNDAKINKLESLIEMRKEEKQTTIEQINDTKDHMAKITADRKEEHEAFQNAQSDDRAAVKLLNSAKDALTAFYEKNDVKMGPTQGLRLMQADPAFAVSEDQAPDATLSGKGNNKGQSKGVVSMMKFIIQDLEDELVNDGKAEAQNQADFEAEMKTAEDLKGDLEAKKVNLADIISKRQGEKAEENKDKKGNNKDRDAELNYKDKITPDCDWILKNFNGRATAREAEMSGLVSAKEFLAGKAGLLQLASTHLRR